MKAHRSPEMTIMYDSSLSSRIDTIASRHMRAHNFLADERRALAPDAIRPAAVSLDSVAFVIAKCFPRIRAFRPQIAAVLPEFDLRKLDTLPVYAADFLYCAAMADLARAFGPTPLLDADQWDAERDRAATLLMDAYDAVRSAVAFAGGDADFVAPAFAASSDDPAAETDLGFGPIAAAA
ncbi:MAG: hypothetical protein JW940_15460 [Polyangiaceae bacterium]|nr:hypothetical protein [Polyangiaceae bacterium]